MSGLSLLNGGYESHPAAWGDSGLTPHKINQPRQNPLNHQGPARWYIIGKVDH
jgi:hypothetical protein